MHVVCDAARKQRPDIKGQRTSKQRGTSIGEGRGRRARDRGPLGQRAQPAATPRRDTPPEARALCQSPDVPEQCNAKLPAKAANTLIHLSANIRCQPAQEDHPKPKNQTPNQLGGSSASTAASLRGAWPGTSPDPTEIECFRHFKPPGLQAQVLQHHKVLAYSGPLSQPHSKRQAQVLPRHKHM